MKTSLIFWLGFTVGGVTGFVVGVLALVYA
jgi:hypothetical protein